MMKNKDCVCQSCGMPLITPDMYGTGPGGLRVEDYCVYCYKDGHFTEDVTMEEMIRLCANYAGGNSRDFRIANMRLQFPHLKRWARKENTQHEYHKAINRVLAYIQSHPGEKTGLKALAGIANISPYHFHRIFKSTIGESVAEYVQRLRLEYVAEQLKNSGLSLGELAEKTGYSSEQALSRAFKKYFNLPPKVFKASFFKETFRDELVPRICKVAAKNTIRLTEESPDGKNWNKLYVYGMMNGLLSDATESLEIVRDGIYFPAITVKESIPASRHAETQVLPEGLYAIFTHKGNTARIPELYAAAFNYWLPLSKYRMGQGMPYVVYLSNPAATPQENRLTEIYIPLAGK